MIFRRTLEKTFPTKRNTIEYILWWLRMKISQKITSSVQRLIAERIPTNRILYYLYPFTLKTTQTDFQNYFLEITDNFSAKHTHSTYSQRKFNSIVTPFQIIWKFFGSKTHSPILFWNRKWRGIYFSKKDWKQLEWKTRWKVSIETEYAWITDPLKIRSWHITDKSIINTRR